MDKYREQALKEYNSEETAAHPGGVGGRPFWNKNSSQFIFAPSFDFPNIPYIEEYTFVAEDKDGVAHTFSAKSPKASLAPIWGDIPEGMVYLRVEFTERFTGKTRLAGARTFYKLLPFPGRDAYPKRARSYRESALMAYRFFYNDPMVQYWATHGVPKPDYPHNVYPAKTFSSIIKNMLIYSRLEPDRRESAFEIARRAADYMIELSFNGDHPLAGLPPTYSFKGLDAEAVNKVAPAAQRCVGTTMMIYPVVAADAYLDLYLETGDEKYKQASLRIAEYYKKTVLPEGSWYLLFDCESGKPLSNNVCVSFKFVLFFNKLYKQTGEECWRELEKGCFDYIEKVALKTYNWEGQFEDVAVSGNYQNLTHFTAEDLLLYISENLADDEKMVGEAVDIMRYVEDQFVVWGEHPLWAKNTEDEIRYSPAGLEQYFCYTPIDSSTAYIIRSFIALYNLKGNRLYLEKAMALADSITRMQDEKTGMYPTFFIGEGCAYGYENFWINCHSMTASVMMSLSELTEKEGIE